MHGIVSAIFMQLKIRAPDPEGPTPAAPTPQGGRMLVPKDHTCGYLGMQFLADMAADPDGEMKINEAKGKHARMTTLA